ncbi:MAG: DUF134 domain-containing protein [Cellulosilyticum sp.]|nr:DUF134 domain-containing protein [Cellulosilyticum sp.]
MARSPRCRRVCIEPMSKLFKINGQCKQQVTLGLEEVESIRLVDFEGLDQGEAASRMEVSRGTFQRILYEARKKVAEALVQGKNIAIEGGNYTLAQEACRTSNRCKECKFLKEESADELE